MLGALDRGPAAQPVEAMRPMARTGHSPRVRPCAQCFAARMQSRKLSISLKQDRNRGSGLRRHL